MSVDLDENVPLYLDSYLDSYLDICNICTIYSHFHNINQPSARHPSRPNLNAIRHINHPQTTKPSHSGKTDSPSNPHSP